MFATLFASLENNAVWGELRVGPMRGISLFAAHRVLFRGVFCVRLGTFRIADGFCKERPSGEKPSAGCDGFVAEVTGEDIVNAWRASRYVAIESRERASLKIYDETVSQIKPDIRTPTAESGRGVGGLRDAFAASDHAGSFEFA